MHRMCCDADIVFQTSFSGTPGISSMMMYSAPMAFSVPELQVKTVGTGILVLSLTDGLVMTLMTDGVVQVPNCNVATSELTVSIGAPAIRTGRRATTVFPLSKRTMKTRLKLPSFFLQSTTCCAPGLHLTASSSRR
nr:hypothetical protein CFP56_11904 [Quercus suber]